MANVVPLSKVDTVVDHAITRVIRGLSLAKKRGLLVRMPKEITFSISVCPDEGINALPRTQTTTASSRKSVTSEPEQEVVTTKGAATTSTRTQQSGETSNENVNQNTRGNDRQTNEYGRSTETAITYID